MNASTITTPVAAKSASTFGVRFGSHPPDSSRRTGIFWCSLALLVAVGSLGLSPQFISLWDIWTADPLRSIGMLIVPASFILILRVWWQSGWELRGTWWGLLPIALAFFSIVTSQNLVFSWGIGQQTVNVFPHVLPLYLYASGVVLLFAGARVWRMAWFPLALLLFAQPVPAVLVHWVDLPLQNLSAHIARSFAVLIGFPPSNSEMLRLMFSPDFGMFIAPGCDGMRGAVTLGYGALILGYLKRFKFLKWMLYVLGAVLLGHIFNLIRLCALVLYYRIAIGHPALENVAKQADYVIGGALFLTAALLFFWVVLRKDEPGTEISPVPVQPAGAVAGNPRRVYWKVAVFAILVLVAAVPGIRATQINRASLTAVASSGALTTQQLDDRLPKQLGSYHLIRSWQEQSAGVTVLEIGAYGKGVAEEATVGIWLLPSDHSIHDSWITHGETPLMRSDVPFSTANGLSAPFDTAMYSDGETDTLAGSTNCTPSFCQSTMPSKTGMHLGFAKESDFTTRGVRFVPIFFRIEMPHGNQSPADAYKQLSAESQSFLTSVDLSELSRRYQ